MSPDSEPIPTVTNDTTILGIGFGSAYVDDFETCYKFYSEVLGFEKQYDMGPQSCFFKVAGDLGFYLEGGHERRAEIDPKSIRAAVTFDVPSASAMYEKLKNAGARMVQDAPMDMGQGNFWFQFYDPAGNILEILGAQ